MESIAEEWLRRVEAEYRSAAAAQHFTLWLIQAGASPDLIVDGMHIAEDEIAHATLSHQVFIDAGGTGGPSLERESLQLRRESESLEEDLLLQGVRFFCLGETVAVPLFQEMRRQCKRESARTALDRILVDEVRHRDFGWTLLDWLLAGDAGASMQSKLQQALPAMIDDISQSYTRARGSDAITEEERDWGLLAGSDYARILERCYQRDYVPRFAGAGIDLPSDLLQAS